MKLRVYLAGRWARRAELALLGNQLRALGVEVTARWLRDGGDDDPKRYAMCALVDVQDVIRADVVVLFTDGQDTPGGFSGGRHFEAGYAMALGKPLYLVGPRENVFHHLPAVQVCDSWADFLRVAILPRPVVVDESAVNN